MIDHKISVDDGLIGYKLSGSYALKLLCVNICKDLLGAIWAGVHVSMAVALYEQGILTLTKAARLARIPVESFLKKLAALGVVVVNQSVDELASDLQNIE